MMKTVSDVYLFGTTLIFLLQGANTKLVPLFLDFYNSQSLGNGQAAWLLILYRSKHPGLSCSEIVQMGQSADRVQGSGQ